MANILLYTEAFDNAAWLLESGGTATTVTADTFAAPAFAGANATLADTVSDISTTVQGEAYQDVAIPNDSTDYVFSVYVRKDTNTTRFPEFMIEFRNGTSFARAIHINTQTGASSAGSYVPAPTAYGVEDIDATWWRVWLKQANSSAGNTVIRVHVAPARAASLGGGANSPSLGDLVVWGGNITNTSTLQAYEPHPFYSSFLAAWARGSNVVIQPGF